MILRSGWWFGTCFIFPYIGNNHPNWLSYFSRWLKPPSSCNYPNVDTAGAYIDNWSSWELICKPGPALAFELSLAFLPAYPAWPTGEPLRESIGLGEHVQETTSFFVFTRYLPGIYLPMQGIPVECPLRSLGISRFFRGPRLKIWDLRHGSRWLDYGKWVI